MEVGDDHDRELEALRLVDAEDADRVELLVGERRLPLLLALAEAPAVLREGGGERRALGGERLDQLVDVRDRLLAPERRARDLRQREALEHLGEQVADRHPPRARVQLGDRLIEAAHVREPVRHAVGVEGTERVRVAQVQEVAVADRAERRAEHAHHGELVGRIGDGAEQVQEVEHLLGGVEVLLALDREVDAAPAERVGVVVRLAERAQQERHVTGREAARGDARGHPLRDRLGLRLARLPGPEAPEEHHLHGPARAALRARVERHVGGRLDRPPADDVDERHQLRPRAVVDGEPLGLAREPADDLLVRLEVGAPEEVDRLLRVADDHQLPRLHLDAPPVRLAGSLSFREIEQYLALQRVGVLELVDHDQPKTLLQTVAHVGMIAQHAAGADEEALEGDVPAARVLAAELPDERLEPREQGRHLAVVDVDDGARELAELPVGLLLPGRPPRDRGGGRREQGHLPGELRGRLAGAEEAAHVLERAHRPQRGDARLAGMRAEQRLRTGRGLGEARAPGLGASTVLRELERRAVLAQRLRKPPEVAHLEAAEQALQELERGGVGQAALQPAGPEIPKDRGGSRPVVLLEGGAHAAFEGILPEQVRGEGVDGPDLDPVELGERADSAAAGRRRVAEELETAVELVDRLTCHQAHEPRAQPVPHLVRGSHGEGEGEEPRWLRAGRKQALEQQPHHTGGLPGARPGLDRRRGTHRATISQYRVKAGMHSGFRRSRP